MAAPRRRRKRAEEPAAPTGKCFCGAPTVLGNDFCFPHFIGDIIADGARRAERRGERGWAALWRTGGAAIDKALKDNLGPKAAAAAYTIHTQRKAAAAAAKPVKPDPFALLHLDARTATVEDVRRVQRALAKIYHTDLDATGLASDAMAEINAAAEAAIKAIKAR